ncbi:hypothetical protein BDD12DRAFT_111349 [Trichophaea hybrida]|nr:hypothetical protein BDD12DRAFT_111349 [Trichophaea hybrida]
MSSNPSLQSTLLTTLIARPGVVGGQCWWWWWWWWWQTCVPSRPVLSGPFFPHTQPVRFPSLPDPPPTCVAFYRRRLLLFGPDSCYVALFRYQPSVLSSLLVINPLSSSSSTLSSPSSFTFTWPPPSFDLDQPQRIQLFSFAPLPSLELPAIHQHRKPPPASKNNHHCSSSIESSPLHPPHSTAVTTSRFSSALADNQAK